MAVAIEQGFPGRRSGLTAQVPRPGVADRLLDRRIHVLVTAAERYASEERFGLGVDLLANGPTFIGTSLLAPDGRREIQGCLERWCEVQYVPVTMTTLSSYFHWKHGPFRHDVYSGRGWLVGADVGRTLGLVCDWTAAHGRWEGGFTFYPPTWSKLVVRSKGHRSRESASPHLPPIRVKAAGAHGYFVEFGRPPGGRASGKRNPDGSHYRGRFLDVIPAAFSLDGIDSDALADHLGAFGLPAVEVPAAVTLDAKGAGELLEVARAVLALAYRLDAEVAG